LKLCNHAKYVDIAQEIVDDDDDADDPPTPKNTLALITVQIISQLIKSIQQLLQYSPTKSLKN
jgi:hypothetical protein